MKKLLFFFIAACFVIAANAANIWYVSTTGSNEANDGKSPTTPFATIAKAITSAVSNDEIRVSEGTYVDTWGTSIAKTLYITGSWSSDFSKRELVPNGKTWEYQTPTVISIQRTIISYSLAKGGYIEGFTFTAQNVSNGTIIGARSTSLKKCIFKDYTFAQTNVTVKLIDFYGSSTGEPTIEDCYFDNIFLPTQTSHIITGATYVDCINCVFSNIKNPYNVASVGNGKVINCIFCNISPIKQLLISGSASTEIVNCLIYNNDQTANNFITGVGKIINTVIANNSNAATINLAPNGQVYNSVIVGNSKGFNNTIVAEIKNCAIDQEIPSSIIGENNITLTDLSDAKFIAPSTFRGEDKDKAEELAATNWNIQKDSPLFNAGNNDFFTSTIYGAGNPFDLAGNKRIINNTIDMGAYELYYYQNGKELTLLDWSAALPTDVVYRDLTGINAKEVASIPVDATLPTDLNPNCLIYAPTGTTASWNNLVIDNSSANIALTDAKAFDCSNTIAATTATYTRNCFTDGGWETIILPFDVTSITTEATDLDGELVFEEFSKRSEANTSVTFAPVEKTALKANVPYLMKYNGTAQATGTKAAFVFNGTGNVQTAINTTDFIGTYTKLNGTADVTGYAPHGDGTTFGKIGAATVINPFRAYLSAPVNPASAPIRYSVVHDGGATGVDTANSGNSIYATDGVIYINTDQTQTINIYTIDGRKMHSEVVEGAATVNGLPQGIYIVNNQKVVIK